MILRAPEDPAARASSSGGVFAHRRSGRVEIVDISSEGLLIRLDDRQHFLPYRKYPWFQGASLREIADVQRLESNHLYWPELDVNVLIRPPH